MDKIAITLILFLGLLKISKAQMSIEEQVADTACLCLSSLDTIQIKSNANVIKMQCLNEAILKNQSAIQKNYATQKRREEDSDKMGIQGSLYITVQQSLTINCPIYALFEKEIQTYREASKAGDLMEKKNGGQK